MFDLITIGDSVIDLFVPLQEAKVLKNGLSRMLELRFGDKVPVGPTTSMVAGNALNCGVGGSRLGLRSAIYTNIGDDVDGEQIFKKCRSEGLSTSYIVRNKGMSSNHHVVLDFEGERTILVYHQPWKFHLPELDKTKWVYLTSLPESFVESNLIDQLINYLERSHARLMFNPGTFQIKVGVKKYPRLLSLVEVLVVNKEEAKLILGHRESSDLDIKKLLKDLVALGPRMVVITDGAEGSFGFDGELFLHLEVFPSQLVEMTGAGDAYSSGLLVGLFNGESLDRAMRWGAANGAAVVEQVGPQAGLLNESEMKQRLDEQKKVLARQF